MYVYPGGLNPSGSLSNLYTTSTNRTEKTIEFLGWYSEDSIPGSGDLFLFDWSCSASDPCSNSNTQPSFIWGNSLANMSCNITQELDPVGHLHSVVYYNNVSSMLNAGSPPLWSNELYLWNYCTNAWDFIYSHNFSVVQQDCSVSNACGWWGPILETFDNPEPEINELGFEHTTLIHDGVTSKLPVSETSFVNPISPWQLFHLEPNSGYGAGNVYTTPGTTTNLTATRLSNRRYAIKVTVASDFGTPDGSVTLSNGGKKSTWASHLSSGAAVLNLELSRGTHVFKAVYSGNAHFEGSSGSLTVIVAK
jgi:hypothetical protein